MYNGEDQEIETIYKYFKQTYVYYYTYSKCRNILYDIIVIVIMRTTGYIVKTFVVDTCE